MLHADNIRVNGGTFVSVTGQGQALLGASPHPTSKGLDLLRAHSCPGSCLNSNERFDPPKCAEKTRDEIIREIMDWINSDHKEAEILWLFGPAGAGKSALAQTIAEMCEESGKHAASNFFSRTAASERSDGNRLISTLVLQLIRIFPDIRSQVKRTIKKDPTIFQQARKRQSEALLLKPLNKVSLANLLRRLQPRSFARLIVIDGLDECHDHAVQTDILRILALAASTLRLPFRILITSRPEGHIAPVFKEQLFQTVSVRTINLATDLDIVPSLYRYLQQQFDDIRNQHPLGKSLDLSWPSSEDIKFIVDKSAPQFIYASTVAKYVASPDHRPDNRLRVILRLVTTPSQDKPFAQLDALYHHIFSEALTRTSRDELYAVLGIIYLSTTSAYPHLQDKSSPEDLEHLLGLQEGDVTLILRPLLSLLWVPDNPKTPIKVFHASLFDFLKDPARSGALEFSFGSMHLLVGRTMVNHLHLLELPEHGEDVMESLSNFVIHWNAYFASDSTDLTSPPETQVYAALEKFNVTIHPLDPGDSRKSVSGLSSFISQLTFHLGILKAFPINAIRPPIEHLLFCLTTYTQLQNQPRKLDIGCDCVVGNAKIEKSSTEPNIQHFNSISFGRRYRWAGLRPRFRFALRETLFSVDVITELDIRSIKDAPPWLLLNCRSLRRLSISLLAGNVPKQDGYDGPPDTASSPEESPGNPLCHQLEYLGLCDMYPVTMNRASPLLVSSDLSKLKIISLEVDKYEASLDRISPLMHLALGSAIHLQLRHSMWDSSGIDIYKYAEDMTSLKELTVNGDIDLSMPLYDKLPDTVNAFRRLLTELSYTCASKYLQSVAFRLTLKSSSAFGSSISLLDQSASELSLGTFGETMDQFEQLEIVTLTLLGHTSWTVVKQGSSYHTTRKSNKAIS